MTATPVDHRVVVVGAGASGIAVGHALRQRGIEDFVVLEKSQELGGTWRDNTYPGCACDVPSVWYSFSFAPNPFWTRSYSRQAEILAYLRSAAWRSGVLPHIRFGTEVTAASWDPAGGVWRVRTASGHLTSRVLVSAAGPLHEPSVAGIEDVGTFGGTCFHSARWDHDHDLTGRRVAVVGTGASAIQFVPRIQRRVSELHLFQRTAPWVLPKADLPVPWAAQQLAYRLPVAETAARAGVAFAHEAAGVAFRHARLMRALQPAARLHLRSQVRDADLRRTLTPDFTLGCKRVLLSNDYYPALTRANVTVHPTAVAALEETGVVASDGTVTPVDTVIFGTGFEVAHPPMAAHVHDGHRVSLLDRWGDAPAAYLGTAVPGYPNLFLVLGPNIVPGHASVLPTIEAQGRFIADAVGAMGRQGWTSLEVRPEVAAKLDADVQRALGSTVYNDGCSSYYLAGGRNIANWPWSLTELHRRMRFNARDFRAETVVPAA